MVGRRADQLNSVRLRAFLQRARRHDRFRCRRAASRCRLYSLGPEPLGMRFSSRLHRFNSSRTGVFQMLVSDGLGRHDRDESRGRGHGPIDDRAEPHPSGHPSGLRKTAVRRDVDQPIKRPHKEAESSNRRASGNGRLRDTSNRRRTQNLDRETEVACRLAEAAGGRFELQMKPDRTAIRPRAGS